MKDLVFTYEVTYSYGQCVWVDFVSGKFKTLKNGSKQFITVDKKCISVNSLKDELTEKERKKYAEIIREIRIQDAKFEAEKDKSLKESAKKWIANIKNMSDEELISENEELKRTQWRFGR